MNVLLFYQSNKHSVFLESKCQTLKELGHNVMFLSIANKGPIHDKLEKRLGIKTYGLELDNLNFLKQVFYTTKAVVSFCRKYNIAIIFSHLQIANLSAILAQRFLKTTVIPCRHHADYAYQINNKNDIRLDRLVTFLSRKLVVVSNKAKTFMVNKEKAKAKDIYPISLGYNFDLYAKPNNKQVQKIKEETSAVLSLIIISRMVPSKNHLTAFKLIKKLRDNKRDVSLIVLDGGQEEESLKAYVSENHLDRNVHFYGFQDNIIDYLAAADLVIHPSISESSNQIIKEASLVNKTGIVCKGVGDFDEYLIHRHNAYMVYPENIFEEMYDLLIEIYNDKEKLDKLAKNLKEEVLDRFEIRKVVNQYLALAEC